jgi:molecular chaperone GrpE
MVEDENNRAEQAENTPCSEPAVTQTVPNDNLQLEQFRKKFDELNDRYLRLAADFDNFRKRIARDQELRAQQANERFALDMLEIADNLERAEKCDDSHIREGLEQIRKLCATVLHRHGITPIESLGRTFDPAEHEAIAHVPSDKEEGMIIDVASRGYRMHDKVIRYAKVAVSKGTEKNEKTE